MMDHFMEDRRCCRCGAEQNPYLMICFDWCRYCKRAYCSECMNRGCCGFMPVVSGAQADTVVIHGSVIEALYRVVSGQQTEEER